MRKIIATLAVVAALTMTVGGGYHASHANGVEGPAVVSFSNF